MPGNSFSLAVLGGDRRQIYMIRELLKCGFRVRCWGFDGFAGADALPLFGIWEECVRDCNAVLLPLPASADEVRVFLPLAADGTQLRLDHLFPAMPGGILLGGRLSQSLVGRAERYKIRCTDYFCSELLQLKNALPSAEGAISVAMQELPVTLDGCAAAVIGYGRIGTLLAEKLRALGALVTVFARRAEILERARLSHCEVRRMYGDERDTERLCFPEGTRVIFNTVPQRILSGAVLERIPQDCVLIDLASAPGGIDFASAEEKGLRAIWATALPGKYAPESAGKYLAETVGELLLQAELP